MAPSWAGQALGKDWEDPAQPPAASRRGSGAALPGASALSLHFFSGAKGRRPHTWAHTTASPQDGGFGPSDPRPHSAKCLSVSLEEVGDRRRVVQCIIFKLPNVWVGVCMKWNKLPTASQPRLPVYLDCPGASRVTTRGRHTHGAQPDGVLGPSLSLSPVHP